MKVKTKNRHLRGSSIIRVDEQDVLNKSTWAVQRGRTIRLGKTDKRRGEREGGGNEIEGKESGFCCTLISMAVGRVTLFS